MRKDKPNLPLVRRLEAVAVRAWPAATVIFDGSWQLRLTPSHPSKRINCIVPLDPSDHGDCAARLDRAGARFAAAGRPLAVRETALMPEKLRDFLRDDGWRVVEEVRMMTADLAALALPEALVTLPGHDIDRFVAAQLKIGGEAPAHAAGLAQVLSAIKPANGLFIAEEIPGEPKATVLCVQDNDFAGILALEVAKAARRAGIATQILGSALRWARVSGAKNAWLQVISTNEAAIALYEKFGFADAYHYRYWRKEKPA